MLRGGAHAAILKDIEFLEVRRSFSCALWLWGTGEMVPCEVRLVRRYRYPLAAVSSTLKAHIKSSYSDTLEIQHM